MKNLTTIALIFAAFLVAAPLEGFAEEYDYGNMNPNSQVSFNLFEEKDSYLEQHDEQPENSSGETIFVLPSDTTDTQEIKPEPYRN